MGKCFSEHRKPSELAVGKFRSMPLGQKFNLERVSPVSVTHSLLWVLLQVSCLLTQLIAHGNTSVKDLKRTTGGCPKSCAFSLLAGRGASTAEKHITFPPASGVPDILHTLCPPAPASLHTGHALRVDLLCEGQSLNAQASATSGRPV